MTAYLVRRALRAAVIFLAVSFLCFLLLRLSPGDFFVEARMNPLISARELSAIRSEYGLTKPVYVQYALWLASMARGDWGFSLATQSPVGPLLWTRALNTLILTTTANLLAWIIAIPAAIWIAVSRSAALRASARILISGMLSLPDLLLALAFLIAAARWRILPIGGMTSPGHEGMGNWARISDVGIHLALPAVALAITMLPPILAHTQSALADVLPSSYIKAAAAHGIPKWRVIFRYALPAASNVSISLFGLSVGTLLSSSLLIEAVMGWPGLGRLLLEATLARDLYVVVAGVVLSTIFLLAGNLIADLLLYASDPRIRSAA